MDDDVDSYCVSNMQWEVFSDGACRGDGHSSFAWVITATWPVGEKRHRFTIAFGYELVQGNYSSFVTELWGLEKAIDEMDSILERATYS